MKIHLQAFSSLCKIYYHFPSTKEFNYGPCFIEFDENAIDILSEQLANQVNLMVKGLVNANEFFWSRIKDMVCNLSRCYTKVTKIAPWRLIVAIINVNSDDLAFCRRRSHQIFMIAGTGLPRPD